MNLNNILNSKLKKVYLIYDNEEYYSLVDYVVTSLKTNFAPTNINSYSVDRYFNYQQIFDLINTQSLFHDKNYFELKYQTKPTVEHQQYLIKLIDMLDDYSLLIITTNKLTKKDIGLEWVKQVNKHGLSVSITNNNIHDIINYKLNQKNITIDATAIDELISLNQNNTVILLNIINQLEILFPLKSHITNKDIIEYNQNNSQYNIYELSNAYLNGDITTALRILHNIYEKPEDAILIMWLITEDIRKLIKIKNLQKKKLPFNQIVEQLKIWGSATALWQKSSNRLSYQHLIAIFNLLSQLDMVVKGLKADDSKLLLGLIIKQICAK